MSITSWATQYVVAAIAFCVIDFLWLTTFAKPLYDKHLGHLLAERPNVAAAVVFYAIFLAGLVYFVIHPAVDAGSWQRALLVGAFFGLVTYATWDLTNLSVLKDFPVAIVPIDLAWGAFLAASVSTVTYAVVQVLPDWAR
ncbi:MAG: DUF2177 family protein [Nocardioides sp.]|jgi:uncharacterized membrane protein